METVIEQHSARPFPQDIYFQTTEFTCGPAVLMMAMAALNPVYRPNRLDEMKIWRESNLIYMGDGHAGCGPHGLACAAIKRGYDVTIYEHNAENVFQPWTNSPEEAAVQCLLAADDRQKAIKRGCRIEDHELTVDLISRLIRENKQLVTLTSLGLEGHWVLLHDMLGKEVFIIDPNKAKKQELDCTYKTDSGRNFIKHADFDDWIRYGPKNSTVMLALSKQS